MVATGSDSDADPQSSGARASPSSSTSSLASFGRSRRHDDATVPDLHYDGDVSASESRLSSSARSTASAASSSSYVGQKDSPLEDDPLQRLFEVSF